jgi:hypothetical protein
MPVYYETTQWPVKRLVDWRNKNKLRIPKHQRGDVWDTKHRIALIDTILRNLPISSITLSGTDLSGCNIYSIEDGKQRIETLVRFCDGKFAVNDQYFEDLSEDIQFNLWRYKVPVLIYSGATDEERIEIFDRLQNGVVLSSGERFHAMRFLSPLIQFTCETLLYDGSPYEEDMGLVWGLRRVDADARIGDGTKRFRTLREAVCLMSGLLWGPEFFTESYDALREKMRKPLSETQKEKAKQFLEILLRIYKRGVQARVQPGEEKLTAKKLRDTLWCPKNFSGYILYSFWEEPKEKWPQMEGAWVDFIVQYRKRPLVLKEKLLSASAGLNKVEERFSAGWLSVQGRHSYQIRRASEEDEEEEDDA